MLDLIKAELLRFRVWAIAAALLHAATLGFFTRVVDPLQQPLFVYQVVASVYVVLGLLLGLHQIGGYRRPNTWLHLLHRPLPAARIALALATASGLLLTVVIALPLLLMLAMQAGFSARVVDTRHLWLPLAAGLLGCIGWLGGAYALLAPRRYSVLVFALPAVFLLGDASGIAAIGVQWLVLIWLLGLLVAAFKPDLSAPPRAGIAELATAVPVTLGIYLLALLASMGYQIIWIALGSHPLNSTPPAGGFIETSRMRGDALLQAGLLQSRDDSAEVWSEQVELSEVVSLIAEFDAFPKRDELTNPAPLEFDDDERRVRWIFSHDRMLFSGVNLADRKHAGVLGSGSAETPLLLPPLPLDGERVLTSNTLYAYDSELQQLNPRIALPPSETFAAPPAPLGAALLVLSDRALYFYDRRAFSERSDLQISRARLALPAPIGSLERIDLIELLDGHLVSLVYGRAGVDGPFDAWQTLWQLAADGSAHEIARRELKPDFPLALRHYGWWLSPALHSLRARASQLFAQPDPMRAHEPVSRPVAIYTLAAALMLLALVVAIALSRRMPMSKAHQLVWCGACLIVGLPALLALWLLRPASGRAAAAGSA